MTLNVHISISTDMKHNPRDDRLTCASPIKTYTDKQTPIDKSSAFYLHLFFFPPFFFLQNDALPFYKMHMKQRPQRRLNLNAQLATALQALNRVK